MNHEFLKLIALVESGSYSAAARRLKLSQPALSVAIQQLEKKYKTKIIEGTRPVTLTKAGEVIYESALRFRSEQAQLQDNLRTISQHQVSLRLGSIDSFSLKLIDSLEGIAVRSVSINNSKKLLQYLHINEIDAAVITTPLESLPESLEVVPLVREQFSLVSAPHMRASVVNQLEKGKIDNFLAYNSGSTTHKQILHFFNTHGVTVRISMSSTSPELLLAFAKLGKGVALLPMTTVSAVLEANEVEIIESSVNSYTRPLSFVYRKQSTRQEQIALLQKNLAAKKLLQ